MRVLLNPRLTVEIWPVVVFFIRITLEDAYLNSPNWFLSIILIDSALVILIRCILTISLDVIKVYMSTVPFLLQPDSGILYPKDIFRQLAI